MTIAAPQSLRSARRDPSRAVAALALLGAIHDAGGKDLQLPDTQARNDLVVGGMLQSYRPPMGRHSLWRLTPEGERRAIAAAARRE